MRKQEEEKKDGAYGVLMSGWTGTAAAVLVCIALFMVLSVVVSVGSVGKSMLQELIAVVCCISTLIGSRIGIGKRGTDKPLAAGILTAALCCILLILGSFPLHGGPSMAGGNVWILCGTMAGGLLAGFAGPVKRRRKRSKK